MSKAITMTYLVKASAANVNASHTEGNVQTIKRVTLPDGSVLPYISGQAVRRMLRDRLIDLRWTLSEPFAKVSGQEVTPPVEPDKYIDEDLFGYMDASGGKRRTSPTRVSALVGLSPIGATATWALAPSSDSPTRLQREGATCSRPSCTTTYFAARYWWS